MTEAPTPRPKAAVALRYGEGAGAPQVVAKGQGYVAEQIIARAKEAGVYVHESKELVNLLMQVDLDAQIPPQLYLAVAELLAWIYRMEQGQIPAATVADTVPKPPGSPTSR